MLSLSRAALSLAAARLGASSRAALAIRFIAGYGTGDDAPSTRPGGGAGTAASRMASILDCLETI
jgi:hypothetical protein